MPIFGAIGLAGTGLTVHRKWLDAISDNLSNVNTVTRTSENAFQARFVVARASQGGGSEVAGILLGNPEGRAVYDPGNPLADGQGMVRRPDIDLSSQMTQLIMAQRGYQANLAVVDRARDAYQQALQLGR
jgi:flagellar basal-body rod protein FlgC